MGNQQGSPVYPSCSGCRRSVSDGPPAPAAETTGPASSWPVGAAYSSDSTYETRHAHFNVRKCSISPCFSKCSEHFSPWVLCSQFFLRGEEFDAVFQLEERLLLRLVLHALMLVKILHTHTQLLENTPHSTVVSLWTWITTVCQNRLKKRTVYEFSAWMESKYLVI